LTNLHGGLEQTRPHKRSLKPQLDSEIWRQTQCQTWSGGYRFHVFCTDFVY